MEISKNGVNPSNTPESGASPSGRRYGGVDKDERTRQRRERLVAAGLVVFGDKGYHATTVRDVCRQASLTSRYFYESFAGMEALFEAVYLDVNQSLMHSIMQALQSTPLKPDLLAEAALRAFLEFIRDDPRRARVALIDALTVGPGIRRVSHEANRDFATLISGFIQVLFPTLEDTGLSISMVSNGLVGANIRVATMWVEDKCSTPLEEVLHNMHSIYLASIDYARRRVDEHARHRKGG